MKSFRRILRKAFDKGIVLVLGLGCLLLYKQHYLPNVLGPLAYGMISAGAIGFTRYIIMDLDSTVDDAEYQRILRILDERKSEILENREKLEDLRQACERFMAMREILEGWRRDPSLVQDKIAILEELLRVSDDGTSVHATKGSTQCAISDEATTHCSSSESRKEREVEVAVGREDEETPKGLQPESKGEIMGDEKEVPFEIIQVEIFEILMQEILQELIEEVSEKVIDEEVEKALKVISEDIQKEISDRLQAELPGNLQEDMLEKSLEEIMEKVQREIFEKLQKNVIKCVPEKTSQQEDISIIVQKQISESRQEKAFEEGHEAIPEKEQEETAMKNLMNSRTQLEEVSEKECVERSRNLKDNKFNEIQLGIEKMDGKYEKPEKEISETRLDELQNTEWEKQEKFGKEIPEAVIDAESKQPGKD